MNERVARLLISGVMSQYHLKLQFSVVHCSVELACHIANRANFAVAELI
jgi:hypothetical protein